MKELTKQNLKRFILESKQKAKNASTRFYKEVLRGRDQLPCGFSWVEIESYNGQKITGRTKIGKMLKELGYDQNESRMFYLWNPGEVYLQNVDAVAAGSKAFAGNMANFGFKCKVNSRLD